MRVSTLEYRGVGSLSLGFGEVTHLRTWTDGKETWSSPVQAPLVRIHSVVFRLATRLLNVFLSSTQVFRFQGAGKGARFPFLQSEGVSASNSATRRSIPEEP